MWLAGGTVQTTYVYGPYGQTKVSGAATDSPYQFQGREMEQITGIYYYRARYLDAGLSRFISRDPMGFAQTGNYSLFALGQSNPVLNTDPTGKEGPPGIAGGFSVAGISDTESAVNGGLGPDGTEGGTPSGVAAAFGAGASNGAQGADSGGIGGGVSDNEDADGGGVGNRAGSPAMSESSTIAQMQLAGLGLGALGANSGPGNGNPGSDIGTIASCLGWTIGMISFTEDIAVAGCVIGAGPAAPACIIAVVAIYEPATVVAIMGCLHQ
jgi:RHS repeat-associated protein